MNTSQNIVNKYNFLNPLKLRIALFDYVQNLFYQVNWFSKPEEVIKAWAGYCVSKHRLLKELFNHIWIESNLCFVPFTFGRVRLPKNLQWRWLAMKDWYHVFLQSNIDWNILTLDASFGIKFSNIYTTSIKRDWISSMTPFWWPYTQPIICRTKDEEKMAKEIFTQNTILDHKDEKRIEEFNKRSLSVSNQ